jgi:hypothetical protein
LHIIVFSALPLRKMFVGLSLVKVKEFLGVLEVAISLHRQTQAKFELA